MGTNGVKAIIENGYVVTLDPARSVFEHGYVAIGEDGRITSVGDMSACPARGTASILDASGMLVLPGLINAHTHTWHILAGGAGQIFPANEIELLSSVEQSRSPEKSAAASRRYAAHMIRTGTTCILNHSLSETSISEARAAIEPLRAAGVRQVFAKDFKSQAACDDVIALSEAYAGEDSLVLIALALDTSPHLLRRGLSNERLVEAGSQLAKKLGLRVSTRSAGDEGQSGYLRDVAFAGRSHVMHLMELGVLDDRWLMAMPGFMDETDIDLMSEARCHVVYTPVHDAFRGVSPRMLPTMSRVLNCALGTGGALFDVAEDMVEQIKACSIIQNSSRLDPTVMPFEMSLEMATINAARALGLADRVGSLEVGKCADIAVFAMDRVYGQVSHKPVSTFISTGRGVDAQAVLVNGELLLRDGKVVNEGQQTNDASVKRHQEAV